MAKLPEHLRGTPTGRERVSREVMSAHQRERVIAAATPVFARRGYQSATVDDILAAGKVGVGNFYSLFEGKENCFLACFDSVLGRARARFVPSAERTEGWGEAAVRSLDELSTVVVEEPDGARLVLIEAQSAGAEARRRYEALLDSGTAWLAAGRGTTSEPGKLPSTFERSAIAGLAYYLQQCLFTGLPDRDVLFEEISAFVLAPILGAQELRRLRGQTVGG